MGLSNIYRLLQAIICHEESARIYTEAAYTEVEIIKLLFNDIYHKSTGFLYHYPFDLTPS